MPIRLAFEYGGQPWNVYRIVMETFSGATHIWYVIAPSAEEAESWADSACCGESAIQRHSSAELVCDYCHVAANSYAVEEDRI